MKLYPLKFEEIYKQYIWGGSGFEHLNKTPPDNFAAESWEIACHKAGMSIVENGYLKGKSLRQLVSENGQDLLGTRVNSETDDFPLLVKFINAKNKLSVQVHPDDKYAYRHEREHGKNEAWIILESEEGAELIIDIRKGVDKREFKKSIDSGNIENCLKRIKVQAGDIINIPTGHIHAIGEGIMLAEIQQNSNITYRVFDYNRKDDEGNTRPLHIDKALDVIDFSEKRKNKKVQGVTIEVGEKSSRTIAIANDYFCLEIFDINEEITHNANGETFLIYIFIDGQGSIVHDNNIINVQKGDTYLIPAKLGEFKLIGNLKFIKSYIPNIDGDILEPLVNLGHTMDDILDNIEGIKDNII